MGVQSTNTLAYLYTLYTCSEDNGKFNFIII